jgi:hypothetical protein
MTPFEQSFQNSAVAGAKIVSALAINNLIFRAAAYEIEVSKLGCGTPPLSETLQVSLMWGTVSTFTEFEA